jgi:hypothetical protein
MTTPTREAIEARLRQVERIRETWKGNPGYAATLDLDIFALRLALAAAPDSAGSTFHFRIDDGPEQTITTASSQYNIAAAAALAHVDELPAHVEIWVPALLPEYGPYHYVAEHNEFLNVVVSHAVLVPDARPV